MHAIVLPARAQPLRAFADGGANSAAVYQKCIGRATAKVFTKATADAFIAADCWESTAATQIEADTGADYYTLEGCEEPEAEATLGGEVFAQGGGVRCPAGDARLHTGW